MSKESIPLAGVIGSPVAHSKSPMLFRHWLRKHAIPGYYVPLDIDQSDLSDVLRTLPKMGFRGVNVTIPHKVRVLEIADQVSDRAALIGAANTLTFQKDGKIIADNTDGYGFMENLRRGAPGWTPEKGPAAVIGAGGAARAVVSALLAAGCPEIRLTNRTRGKAEAFQVEFGQRVHVYDWVQAGNTIDDATLVVNTSSLGMVGKPEFRVPLDGLTQSMVVSDIVYTPLETTLIKAGRKAGSTIVDGLGMLLYQAVPGFERWFGQTPIIDDDVRKKILSL